MHSPLVLLASLLFLSSNYASAAPAPLPSPSQLDVAARAPQPVAQPTPLARRSLSFDASPNDLYDFYKPVQEFARLHPDGEGHGRPAAWDRFEGQVHDVEVGRAPEFVPYAALKDHYEAMDKRAPSPTPLPTKTKRDENPNVPLADLPYPTFPAEYASCPKCEAGYPGISSCMGASAVFANATSIFNDPFSYIQVIKCACTDTFNAVYPQCVDCFQNTNQCWWLGTDAKGTGAPKLVTNIRQICGLGSALLGGVAAANSMNGTYTPTAPGTYIDVPTGKNSAGYQDQSSGPIFGNGASSTTLSQLSAVVVVGLVSASVFLA